MSYATISYNLFLIYLAQSCQTPVDNTCLTNSADPGPQIGTSFGELIQVKTALTIGSLFQLNSSLLNTSRCAPFYVSFGLPQVQRHQRNFDCKGLEESPPQELLATGINRQLSQQQIIRSSGPAIQEQKTGKHCQTSNQSIKHLQIGCTYFSRTTPTQSNLKEHRQECTFIKYVKTQQIQTGETPKLKTFQSLLQCIKRLAVLVLCLPTALNCQWHLSCSQQNHPKTLTIKPEFQFYSKLSVPTPAKPNHLLKRLYSCWYKARPETRTQNQGDQTKEQSVKTMLLAFFPRQN